MGFFLVVFFPFGDDVDVDFFPFVPTGCFARDDVTIFLVEDFFVAMGSPKSGFRRMI
jgi:hypothetical protein